MTNQSHSDCIIVGGGIGGAVLALILGQRKKQVLVVEKDLKAPAPIGRPEILTNPTVNRFIQLGMVDRFLKEAAIALKGLQVFDSKTNRLILELSEQDFLRAQVQPYSTDPAKTRQIILEAAEQFSSVSVKHEFEVKDLIREDGRISGIIGSFQGKSTQLHSNLIIGDDGVHSRIRNGLGIRLKLRDFPFIFLAASGDLFPGQPENIGQVWMDPRNIKDGLFAGIFMPQPMKKNAFVFLMSEKAYEHFSNAPSNQFYEAARRLSPLCREFEKQYRFPDDLHLFKRPFGHSKIYVSEGVALLGDAAHPVTPVGGQGANMSVADAISLAEKIGTNITKNGVDFEGLKQYERERWPANQRSFKFSVRADFIFRFLFLFPFLTSVGFIFLKWMNRNSFMKDRFLKSVSQTFESRPNPK